MFILGLMPETSLEGFLTSTSLLAIGVAGAISLLSIIIAILAKQPGEILKKFLFASIAVPITLATFYLTGSTIYLNLVSETKGPVHWHADFEIIVCGEKIDLVNPKGLSNRLGTPAIHEHNDNRTHVEGVLINLSDASLGNFFKVIGGELNKESITIPTTQGTISKNTGDRCGGSEASLQVFAYETQGMNLSQKKLEDPSSYILSPHGNVPPGSCLIIEFDVLKDKTDRLCTFYKLAIEQGKIHGP